jgi:hypothetical protein
VFRHDHHREDVTERIDQLMAAVIVPDDAERVARLAEHVAPDFVYVPVVDLDQAGPAHFRFSWQRVEDGVSAMEGWAFGLLDDGAIQRIVVFEGLAPGGGAG